MQKILFFDCRELETVHGFRRELEPPVKDSRNPLLTPDRPCENGNLQLYGSVVRNPAGAFQLWYSCIQRPWNLFLGYAESADGYEWHKPGMDILTHEGQPTNLVLGGNTHGPAVILDSTEPDPGRRYKLLAGADPGGCISAFFSTDGIHWCKAGPNPVMTTDPDCPMGLFRAPDGRYVAFHRVKGYGRRVFRSESWDFRHWSAEPRMVLEPDVRDDSQTQFYGFGAVPYGSYEIGTLWLFHTDTEELRLGKMRGYQEAELTYARSGYAVHRALAGTPFVPHGGGDDWDRGNLQCASQPVFLEDEIRYYFMGTDRNHSTRWELEPQRAGIGVAHLRPDRFVALVAGAAPATLLTKAFRLSSERVFINAAVAGDGWIKAELLDASGTPLPGYGVEDSFALAGDALAHELRWRATGQTVSCARCPIRVRLSVCRARVYSIFNTDPGEVALYHQFRSVWP